MGRVKVINKTTRAVKNVLSSKCLRVLVKQLAMLLEQTGCLNLEVTRLDRLNTLPKNGGGKFAAFFEIIMVHDNISSNFIAKDVCLKTTTGVNSEMMLDIGAYVITESARQGSSKR